MRLLRNLLWFVVGLLIAAVLCAPSAHATHLQFDRAGNIVGTLSNNQRQSIIDSIGMIDRNTGQLVVKGSTPGSQVAVPVTIARKVSTGAIAKAVAKAAVKTVPGVGTAVIIGELIDELSDKGWSQNASGDLTVPESADVAGDAVGTGYGESGRPSSARKTVAEACEVWSHRVGSTFYDNPAWTVELEITGPLTCKNTYRTSACSGCTQTQSVTLIRYLNFYQPSSIVPTEIATQEFLDEYLAQNADFRKRLYDEMMRRKALDSSWPAEYSPINESTPVDITAPVTSSAPRVVSTTTKSNPDGSTDTTTRTEQTTVSPRVTGTTVGDARVDFPVTTTYNSTTVNNLTNVTTNETTVVNEPETDDSGASEPPEDTCAANPTRAGCAVLGDPPPAEDIPKQDVPISITPVVFASAAGCPAPITFEAYGSRSISFEPMCNTVSGFRPLFLALASLTAAIVFMGALKL